MVNTLFVEKICTMASRDGIKHGHDRRLAVEFLGVGVRFRVRVSVRKRFIRRDRPIN